MSARAGHVTVEASPKHNVVALYLRGQTKNSLATHPVGDYFIISHLSSLLGLQDHPNFTDIETETQKVVSTPLKLSPDSMLQCLYTMTYTKACDDLTPASQNSPENTWGGLAPVQGSSESVLKVPSTTRQLRWKQTLPLTSKKDLGIF